MVVSFDTKIVKSDGRILTILASHDDKFDLVRMLNTLNNVDVDGLRFSPENMREANKRKEVLVKQLEVQWSDRKNIVSHIIHPDSTYLRKRVRLTSELTDEKSLFGDGYYDMLYFAPASHLNAYESNVLSGGRPLCEYDLFQGTPQVIGGSSGLAVIYGEDIKGVMFLMKDSLNVYDRLLKALDTGSLALTDDKDGKMNFIFLNTLYGMKRGK